MSRANKHGSNQLLGTALYYMQNVLGPWKSCRRTSCKGTMIPVLTRYRDHGPLNEEFECSSCGKVIKDPRFKKQRQNHWKNRHKNNRKKDKRK